MFRKRYNGRFTFSEHLIIYAGERIFERILLPIVDYIVEIKRQKPRREERPGMSANILSPKHILNVHFIKMYVKMSYAPD